MTLSLICLLSAIVFVRSIEYLDGATWFGQDITSEFMRWAVQTSLFAVVFLVSWRPITSLAVTSLVAVVFFAANTTKKKVVFEPITFSDLGLLGQIIRHPRFYFLDNPMLVGPPILIAAVCLSVAFAIEPAVAPWPPIYVIGGIFWTGTIFAAPWIRQKFTPIVLDEKLLWGSEKLGLMTALVIQYISWHDWRRAPAPTADMSSPNGMKGYDLVVIQLESFVDMTPHIAGHSSIWRELQDMASIYGQLAVQARGANTMRTEHAVLSGIANAEMQFDRFDPYMRRGHKNHGYFHKLRTHGWRTIFIHPNDLLFFRRERVLPLLGFDVIIGQQRFENHHRTGPHVGDDAVVHEAIAELSVDKNPKAIFAVTMENHGPWKARRLPGIDAGLPTYLEHQRNTDRALRELISYIQQSNRRTIIVLYGDHLPALADLPAGLEHGKTDYVIIDTHSDVAQNADVRELTPEALIGTAFALASPHTSMAI